MVQAMEKEGLVSEVRMRAWPNPRRQLSPQLKGDGGFEVFEAEMHLASASPRGVMAQMEGDAYGVLTETRSLSAAIRVCVTESFVQGGDP